MYGKHITEETRKKLSAAKIGQGVGGNNPNSKLSDDQRREIYKSRWTNDVARKDLAEEYGVSTQCIYLICKNSFWAE